METRAYTHLDLGSACLDAAIKHYLSGEYVPAIVLATAAEDHFGGPHAKPPEQSDADPRAHKQDARDFDYVYTHMWGEHPASPWTVVNEVKNRAKHYSEEPLRIDAEDEAYWALDRAFTNYALGNAVEHPRRYDVQCRHMQELQRGGRGPSE